MDRLLDALLVPNQCWFARCGLARWIPPRSGPSLFLVGALALSAGASPLAAEPGERYALVVGAGAYDQWNDLVNPVPDAEALANELSSGFGFRAEILESPDRRELITAIRRYLALDYGPNDQLVVAFAGHGTYDELSRIGYLAARDSAVRTRDPTFVSLLSYPWLLQLLDTIDCPQILLIVDACYAGSLERLGGSSGERGLTRRFLTSGGTEYVPDGRPGEHTPFMRHLLEGLRSIEVGTAGLGSEAFSREAMGGVQPKPRWGAFGRDGGTDFVLERRAASRSRPARARQTAPSGNGGASAVGAAVASAGSSSQAEASRLRSEPGRVTARELKRAFERTDLCDMTWNPYGDFPNQYRVQARGDWDVVLDLESNLVWQQGGSSARMSHEDALAYVRQLNRERHGGSADWRLPTLEELGSLVEPVRMADGLHLSPDFDPEIETSWSGDVDRSTGEPYFVSFRAGRVVLAYGGRKAFVRAVRSP